MQLDFVVALIILGISGISANYKIPEVNLKLTGVEGFSVSIPDEKGIEKVLYIVEINNGRATISDYVTKSINNTWSMQKNEKNIMGNSDKVEISIMVQHNSAVYKNTQIFSIENNIVKLVIQYRNVDISKKCPLISENILERAATDKPAHTVVKINKDEKKIDFTNELIFEENFDGPLDTTKWSHNIGMPINDELTDEFVLFNDSDTNIHQEKNYLKIIPTMYEKDINSGKIDLGERCTTSVYPRLKCVIDASDFYSMDLDYLPPVHSALITTKKSFAFRYGRIEVRAKLSKGDWLLPYITLQPVADEDPFFHKEIHIAFIRGNEHFFNENNEDIGGSLLYGGLKKIQKNCVDFEKHCSPVIQMPTIKKDEHFGDRFHNYSLTWTKKEILLAVDGENYGKISNEFEMLNDEFYYISLGVSAGGHVLFMDNTNKPWLNSDQYAMDTFQNSVEANEWKKVWKNSGDMKIEHIRVYSV